LGEAVKRSSAAILAGLRDIGQNPEDESPDDTNQHCQPTGKPDQRVNVLLVGYSKLVTPCNRTFEGNPMYAGVRPVFHQFNRCQALITPAGAWPRLNGQKTEKGQAAGLLALIRWNTNRLKLHPFLVNLDRFQPRMYLSGPNRVLRNLSWTDRPASPQDGLRKVESHPLVFEPA
jgi:hypothetical protein